MLYDVLVIKNGDGELRFTIERDSALSQGDGFEHDSTSYRVVRVEEGHGPFDATLIAEWLTGSGGPAHARPPDDSTLR
jgi:hypothetical protein